ncbi:MAG: response regulator transcription factor [Ignavibacterium sp.]|nr:response regulator transcription factor [Ignavibacterium sp.]MDW8374250.1 response regulator transcription factor [Ignavibacteriales bacterium]
MITVALAEDNDFLAKSIKEKLSFFSDEIKLLFRAKNGKEFISILETYKEVQVALMDIEMPIMDGITATAELSEKYPNIKVIMLTVFDDDEKIFKAIRAGAMGYLLKEESPQKIVDSIKLVLEGGAPMSATIASKTLQLLRNPISIDKKNSEQDFNLSSREIEVLELLKKGYDYNKTAEQLFISPYTVRKHIENIYRKLQVHNKIEAVQKAIQNRII